MTVLEQFSPAGSGLGLMASVGEGATPDELLIGFATSATTSILRSYSLSGGSFSVVGSGQSAPIVGLGGTHFGAGGNGFGTSTELFAIDPLSGVSALVGVSPFSYAGDLAEHPATGVLYAATTNPFLVTVDQSDASMVTLGPLSEAMVGLAFSQDGRLWAVSSGSKLYEIDPSNGSGSYVMDVLGVSFDLASEVVPEPSTALLIGLGLAVLGARRQVPL